MQHFNRVTDSSYYCLETTVQADSTEFDVSSAIKMIGPSINHALFGDSSIATVSRGMSMGSHFSVACILFEHPLQCFAKVFRVGSCIREASSFRVYLSAIGNGTSYKSAFEGSTGVAFRLWDI